MSSALGLAEDDDDEDFFAEELHINPLSSVDLNNLSVRVEANKTDVTDKQNSDDELQEEGVRDGCADEIATEESDKDHEDDSEYSLSDDNESDDDGYVDHELEMAARADEEQMERRMKRGGKTLTISDNDLSNDVPPNGSSSNSKQNVAKISRPRCPVHEARIFDLQREDVNLRNLEENYDDSNASPAIKEKVQDDGEDDEDEYSYDGDSEDNSSKYAEKEVTDDEAGELNLESENSNDSESCKSEGDIEDNEELNKNRDENPFGIISTRNPVRKDNFSQYGYEDKEAAGKLGTNTSMVRPTRRLRPCHDEPDESCPKEKHRRMNADAGSFVKSRKRTKHSGTSTSTDSDDIFHNRKQPRTTNNYVTSFEALYLEKDNSQEQWAKNDEADNTQDTGEAHIDSSRDNHEHNDNTLLNSELVPPPALRPNRSRRL